MDKGNRLDRRVRHAVELDASVTRSSGTIVACKLSDFSLDGCRLTGFFNIGERVEVRVRPIGVLPADIRWAGMGRAGARFLPGASRSARGTN